MVRQRRGEPGHEQAAEKCHQTLLAKYGSEEAVHQHFTEMGRKGGLKKGRKGFALDPEKARKAGANGGAKSMRGYKLIKEDEYNRWYKSRETNEIIKYVYDIAQDKYIVDDQETIIGEIENEDWL